MGQYRYWIVAILAAAFVAGAAAESRAQTENNNENARRLLRDGMPLILPTAVIPLYMSTIHKSKSKKAARTKRSVARKKKK